MIEASLMSRDRQGFGNICGGECVLLNFLDLSNRCKISQKTSSKERQCESMTHLYGLLAYPVVQVQLQFLDEAGPQ